MNRSKEKEKRTKMWRDYKEGDEEIMSKNKKREMKTIKYRNYM